LNTSINEVAALARKAARGAGYSWSMADEAAFATGWLCRQGLDGAALLANHLKIANDLGTTTIKLRSLNWPWTGHADGLCALSAGASISDLAASMSTDNTHVEFRQVISATLLLPYFGLTSQHSQQNTRSSADPGITTNVSCDHFDAKIITTPTNSWLHKIDYLHTQPHSRCTDVHVEFTLHTKSSPMSQTQAQVKAPTLKHRTIISAETLADLNRFAENTYAPATEVSRQGAGAGETDND